MRGQYTKELRQIQFSPALALFEIMPSNAARTTGLRGAAGQECEGWGEKCMGSILQYVKEGRRKNTYMAACVRAVRSTVPRQFFNKSLFQQARANVKSVF